MERLRNQIRNLLKSFQLKNSSSEVLAFEKVINDLIQVKIDAVAPVPFAFSALFQVGSSLSDVGGMGEMLDFESTNTIASLAEGEFDGFTVYLDTQRGSYWGDIIISVVASDEDVFTSDVKLSTLDGTQCNSLVSVSIDGSAVSAEETYTLAITASGGGHSITRTFTLNVIADPE